MTGLDRPGLWLGAVLLLALLAFFATLRQALLRAVPARVLARVHRPERRARIHELLERTDSLATSASALKIACDLVFLLLVLALVSGTSNESGAGVVDWGAMGLALAVTVPLILVAGEALPGLMARTWGEVLLARALSVFEFVQLPVALFAYAMERLRRLLARVLRLRVATESERRILADIRQVIEDAPAGRDLDETEREIIENVMEFRDVDAAEVMTPRTEISAVEADVDLETAAGVIAECEHSRVPVYRQNLDSIVGFVTARDVLKARARGELSTARLEDVLRPAYFVPETKQVSELLAEFRRERLKMAIVLDEYGGTAGIVTMGDILEELVGDIPDEFDEDEPAPIREILPGVHDVDASLRVGEVNEDLGLELPEEQDFETLGGFVLSELGHFPKNGESFVRGDEEFTVIEANDRRVLVVRIRSLVTEPSPS